MEHPARVRYLQFRRPHRVGQRAVEQINSYLSRRPSHLQAYAADACRHAHTAHRHNLETAHIVLTGHYVVDAPRTVEQRETFQQRAALLHQAFLRQERMHHIRYAVQGQVLDEHGEQVPLLPRIVFALRVRAYPLVVLYRLIQQFLIPHQIPGVVKLRFRPLRIFPAPVVGHHGTDSLQRQQRMRALEVQPAVAPRQASVYGVLRVVALPPADKMKHLFLYVLYPYHCS